MVSLRLWQDMGCAIDWSALPVLFDLYGVLDAERMIRLLLAIRRVVDNERAIAARGR